MCVQSQPPQAATAAKQAITHPVPPAAATGPNSRAASTKALGDSMTATPGEAARASAATSGSEGSKPAASAPREASAKPQAAVAAAKPPAPPPRQFKGAGRQCAQEWVQGR
jgi:hypothetical protein